MIVNGVFKMSSKISVVSPFFNEEGILAKAINRMVNNLEELKDDWELIIVNDGSTDNSLSVAKEIAANEPRIKIVTYDENQGRGYALKQGIDAALGDIIVTTEVDCSWGDNIVASLAEALKKDKKLDIVIASTNLNNKGYVNVPSKRVFLSKSANRFLGLAVSKHITMYTGMTRGYRASSIKTIPISEKGKEFHLDVLAKALSFGLKIGEIPATITWQDEKLVGSNAPKRKSSSKIPNLIRSHILFGLSGKPYRYLFSASGVSLLLTFIFLFWGVVNFLIGKVSINLLALSFSNFIITILLGGIGILALQQNTLLRELWITRREINDLKNKK